MATLGYMMTQVRSLLNDQAGAVFTDEVLLPFIKMAADDMQGELEDNQLPFVSRTSGAILVPAGSTTIGGTTGPALPPDVLDILAVWERTAGTNNDFSLMRRVQFLPKTDTETSFHEVWTYQDQIVQFPKATSDIEIKMDYLGANLVDATPTTEVRFNHAKMFLQYRTAALAAEFIGENDGRAEKLNGNAERCLDTMLSINIKSQQSVITRRRPFMANYRRGGQW